MPRLTMKIDYDEAREELEGFMQGNAMASFAHLHFGSNPTVAPAFVERCRTNTTKAAAVAAASASAVAGAGPIAAAAAGAAAAAAVAAALGEQSQELTVPYHHSGITLIELSDPPGSTSKPSRPIPEEGGSPMRIFEKVRSLSPRAFSDAMFEGPQIRRSESVDAIKTPSNGSPARLVRSGSEVWSNDSDHSLKVELRNGYCRGNSFSEHSESAYNETTSMRPPIHMGTSETVGSNGNSVVRVTASSLHGLGNRKVDIEEDDIDHNHTRQSVVSRPRNGQVTKKYNLDVNRQQLITRIGKPLNKKLRLPERIVSLLPGATEMLLEIGKLPETCPILKCPLKRTEFSVPCFLFGEVVCCR